MSERTMSTDATTSAIGAAGNELYCRDVPLGAGRFQVATARASIDVDLHPVFATALRHLQQPNRHVVREQCRSLRRLSIDE
jgi:hypothetical protein